MTPTVIAMMNPDSLRWLGFFLVVASLAVLLSCAATDVAPVQHGGMQAAEPQTAPPPRNDHADTTPTEREPVVAPPRTPKPWDLPAATTPRDWRYVVVHHSASPTGNADIFHRYHRDVNGWDGLGYHFVIGNGSESGDGEIEIGFRWPKQREGAHAGVTEYNQRGIGICLVGDFTDTQPSEAQLAALVRLIDDLRRQFAIDLPNVIRHCDCKSTTACPGDSFPWFELKRRLRDASAPWIDADVDAGRGTTSAASTSTASPPSAGTDDQASTPVRSLSLFEPVE